MYNFHNHTGKDEEYVLEAIKNGYEVMGFSDHAPYLFPKGHHSGYRIQLDKAQDYANSIKTLKEKYKGVIDIKLGYELEYFPALWDEEIEYLKGFEYDYLILTKPIRLPFWTNTFRKSSLVQKQVVSPTLHIPTSSILQVTKKFISKKLGTSSPH